MKRSAGTFPSCVVHNMPISRTLGGKIVEGSVGRSSFLLHKVRRSPDREALKMEKGSSGSQQVGRPD